jgi:serine/threonine protein kinase
MAPDEVLAIARQIADALEAAHEKRDRSSRSQTREHQADVRRHHQSSRFRSGEGGGGRFADRRSELSDFTAAATQMGVILGTAAYMAPEQARGKPVDKRADIWAFGCVLYEMITGSRAFEGDEVTDVLASVLAREPKLESLRPTTPLDVRTLIARCLLKDRKERVADIAVALYILQEASASPADLRTTTCAASFPRARLVSIAAAGIIIGVIVTAASKGLSITKQSENGSRR